MTVAFVLIPIIMTSKTDGFGWEKSELWMVYLPAMLLGVIAMGPAAVFGEKKNKPKLIFTISVALFALAFFLMGYAPTAGVFIAGVISFFIGFNMLEPLIQSMISKFAKVHQKGAALGISNSLAYFFTFLGGTTAGLLLDVADRQSLGMFFGLIGVFWLLWTLKMPNPIRHSHLFVPLAEVDQEKLNTLEHEHVAEWYINETEAVVVVKYRSDAMDREALKAQISK